MIKHPLSDSQNSPNPKAVGELHNLSEIFPLPRIKIAVNDHHIDALLDTGAMRNVIQSRFLTESDHLTAPQRFRMACGDVIIDSQGTTKLIVTILGASFEVTFQAINSLNQDMILGAPFLYQNNAVFDYKRRCVYIGTEDRITVFWDQAAKQEARQGYLPEALVLNDDSLRPLFEEFADLFTEVPTQATTVTVKHKIQVIDDTPFNIRPYPMSPAKKKIMYDQIEEMLKAGVIEPSTARYSSPPIIIERPGKKPRFCIDYRKLNEVTADEASVLPKIHESVKDLGDSRIFTVLDLKSGYWQIPLEDGSKEYSTFTTPDGAAYQFNVMPFGLKTAPCTFQKFMAKDVLTGFLHHFCKVYLDDIIVYSVNLKAHMSHLRTVFERLRLHNLKVSPEKCVVATSEIVYLGHQIKQNTSRPLEKHILEIQNYPVPTTKRQLQSFLGLCNWVREYIPNVAIVTKPLTKMLSKECRYKWNQNADYAFRQLKEILSGRLELHRPDFSKQFILQTDASLLGLSAVLYQMGDEGQKYIVSYASNTLSPAERRYHINELECLAVVTYVKKYKMYLTDKPFIVRTDNRALLWLHKHQDEKTKFTRWSLLLQEYSFKIEHCPGKENILADFLSRHPQGPIVEDDDDEDRMYPPNFYARPAPSLIAVLTHAELYDSVMNSQTDSRRIQSLIERWNQLCQQEVKSSADQTFYDDFQVSEGILRKRVDQNYLLVTPKRRINEVIYHYHDRAEVAHPGRDETVRKVLQRYYFPDMTRTIGKYIGECIICKTVKARQVQPKAPLRSLAPTNPFETLSVDVIGPLQRTKDVGNRYLLMVEDVFSKWIEAKAFIQVDGRTIAKYIDEEIIARYGVPKVIISDNGGHFNSGWYTTFCDRNDIEIYYTPTYHQRSNPVERRVQEVKKTLKTLMYHKQNDLWDRYVHQMLRILRSRKNAATGQTPSMIVLGYDPAERSEWALHAYRQQREDQREVPRLERVREARKTQYSYKRKYAPQEAVTPVVFKVGDKVMTKRVRKDHTFAPSWSGPHKVLKKFSDEVYLIQKSNTTSQTHVDDMRPAPTGEHEMDMTSSEEEEDSADERRARRLDGEASPPEDHAASETRRPSETVQVQIHAPPKRPRLSQSPTSIVEMTNDDDSL